MDEHGALLTLAEVGVAFAGFASIVMALNRRGNWSSFDTERVRTLLVMSLAPTFYALLPFGFVGLDWPEPVVWRASATTAFVAHVVLAASIARRMPLHTDARYVLPGAQRFVRVGFGITALVMLLMLAVAANLIEAKPSAYYFGLLLSLLVAALQFGRSITVLSPAAPDAPDDPDPEA